MIATCNLCQELLSAECQVNPDGTLLDSSVRLTAEYLQMDGLAMRHFMQRHPAVLEECLLPACADFQMFLFGKMLGGDSTFDLAQREHLQRVYWMITGRLIIERGATSATTGWPRTSPKQDQPN